MDELQIGDLVVRDITAWNIGGSRAPHGKVVDVNGGIAEVHTIEVGRTTFFVYRKPDDGKYKTHDGYQFVKVTNEQLDSGELIPGAETKRALM